jgi:hypothetical protein
MLVTPAGMAERFEFTVMIVPARLDENFVKLASNPRAVARINADLATISFKLARVPGKCLEIKHASPADPCDLDALLSHLSRESPIRNSVFSGAR